MEIKVRKGHSIELTIEKMVYGGRGAARIENLVIFVKGGVPGDRLRILITKKKKTFAEARILEILDPSPYRVNPPCPYHGYCGGCQWQSVVYQQQLYYKKEIVRESLEHIGGFKDICVRPAIPSVNIFAYRNKMEFSFSDRRWFLPQELHLKDIDGGFALGLHAPGTFSKVIDMDGCLLQGEKGNEILRHVKEYVKKSGVPVYGLKSHQGFWRYLMLRYSLASDEWMVNLITSQNQPEIVGPLADSLISNIDGIKTIINNITNRKASIAVGEIESVLYGKGYLHDNIGRFSYQVSSNSFFQTNTLGALEIYKKLKDYGEFSDKDKVLDLYSGTGTIPIFLADMVQEVIGIEINKSAVLDAMKNCEDKGIENCRFICGDIREKLADLNFRPDVLILDPPRSGIHKDVLAQILSLAPEKIVYISCNPTTLARDLSYMRHVYDLMEVTPIDMFPHTYHIESVVKLRLAKN